MDNQIFLSDCFDIMRNLPDNSIDAIITDPPYLYLKHKLDADYDEQMFIDEVFRILKKDSILGFFGRGQSFYKLNHLASQKGFKFKEEIVWDKVRISSPVLRIGRCHETFVIYGKGNKTINKIKIDRIDNVAAIDSHRLINDIKRILSTINSIKTTEDLIAFKNNKYNIREPQLKHCLTVHADLPNFDRGYSAYKALTEGCLMPSVVRFSTDHYNYQHPTQKPLELMKRLIELLTPENGLVLDPFAGSFTTAIACLETGRRYICIEKEEEYFNIGKERIKRWHNEQRDRTGTYELPPDIERIKEDKYGQLSLF